MCQQQFQNLKSYFEIKETASKTARTAQSAQEFALVDVKYVDGVTSAAVPYRDDKAKSAASLYRTS